MENESSNIDSIVSAIRARDAALRSAIESLIPTFEIIEQSRKSNLASLVALQPTLTQMVAAQKNYVQSIAQISPPLLDIIDQIDDLITPFMQQAQEAQQFIKEFQEQQEEMGKTAKRLIDEMARSRGIQIHKLSELEERIRKLEQKSTE